MSQIPLGTAFLRNLVEGLNLGGRAIRRCVIDVSIDKPVKLFVEEFANAGQLEGLLGELPKIDPEIIWTDRVEVTNNGDNTINLVHMKVPDQEARVMCKALLQTLKTANEAKKEQILDLIFEEKETSS